MPGLYTIRNMNQAEMTFAMDLAEGECWNPGREDIESFYAADRCGFLIGELDGRPISCISGVRYGKQFAFLGLYIVHPAFRGCGYGYAIFQEMLTRLTREGRTLGLDGVPSQMENYTLDGFHTAYRHVRYRRESIRSKWRDPGIQPGTAVPFARLEAYDEKMFGSSRAVFLAHWLKQSSSRTLVYLNDSETVCGYGTVRMAREGFRIGPLFADDPALAGRLFDALCAEVPPGAAIFLDVPDCNAEALQLVRTRGMSPVFETMRMYNGNWSLPTARIFGATTLELG